ncbi:hypothetical protein CEXT_174241 [Caerostris extrusa]|uniref:Uncharacterized protein n=1 Tax=Caerostris extrusa TaxID=172846 RepID=A0AAV4SDQ8_CAEEX|nr:hypothetical protein CEXT_174241 [Caerostris extrusa]
MSSAQSLQKACSAYKPSCGEEECTLPLEDSNNLFFLLFFFNDCKKPENVFLQLGYLSRKESQVKMVDDITHDDE